MSIARRLPLLLPLLLASPAFAVYKCEVEGKVVYSDTACAGGTRLDAPAAPDAREANRKLARDKAEAQRLAAARHQREAQESRQRRAAAQDLEKREKKCAQLAQRRQWATEDAAKAGAKSADRMQRKVRRTEQAYLQECGA